MFILQSEYVTRLVLSSIIEFDEERINNDSTTYVYKVKKDNLVFINISSKKFTVDNLEEKFVNGKLYKYRIYYNYIENNSGFECDGFECSNSKELKDKLEFYKRSYV